MEPSEISNSFSFREGRFGISGVDLETLTQDSEGPFYVYDLETIKRQYGNLRSSLPEKVDIYYAMKANSNLAIVKAITGFGTGLEVASGGEILASDAVKANPHSIIFAGPGKTKEELDMAMERGIHSINAESLSELKQISDRATRLGKRANVSLRINPNFKIKGATLMMGGEATQFGIGESELESALFLAKELPGLDFKGIHVYAGTNITDHGLFLENLKNSFKLAERANRVLPVYSINVGSGLSVPYREGDKVFPLEGLGKKVEELIAQYGFIEENGSRVIFEPGRYMVAQSGIYVAKVVDVKSSKGKNFVVLEGGINHMLRPALIDKSEHQVYNLSREFSDSSVLVDVVGPLCTPLDVLARETKFPKETAPGDYVGVFCAGAYGFSESMPLFLSHNGPSEYLVHNGKFDLVRKPFKVEESLSKQVIPEGI